MAALEQAHPGGQRCARQGRGFFVTEVFRNRYQTVFMCHDDLRQHPAGVAATIRLQRIGTRRTLDPALEEYAGDAVADPEPRDVAANGDHFAGAIRQGYTAGVGVFAAVVVVQHVQVAPIERHRPDFDQHFTDAGFGPRHLLEDQLVAAGLRRELVLPYRVGTFSGYRLRDGSEHQHAPATKH